MVYGVLLICCLETVVAARQLLTRVTFIIFVQTVVLPLPYPSSCTVLHVVSVRTIAQNSIFSETMLEPTLT